MSTIPESPSYIAIDCAIIGSLTRSDQTYLARNLLAFFNRDYAEVVRLHLESGWIPDGTDPQAFERVIRRSVEPIFAKPLNEISFGQFLLQLFRTAREFDMEIQPQLVLLQKTLLYIEGLGRRAVSSAGPLADGKTLHGALDGRAPRSGRGTAGIRRTCPGASGSAAGAARRAAVRREPPEIARAHQPPRIADALATIESRLARVARSRRLQRISGTALLILASLLLFDPIADSLNKGDGFHHAGRPCQCSCRCAAADSRS